MRRNFVEGGFVRWSVLFVAMGVIGLVAGSAQACPMCNQSIANENDLPRAYMVSILFMLAMPATVFTGFGLYIAGQIRSHKAAQAALLAGDELSPARADAPRSDTPVLPEPAASMPH